MGPCLTRESSAAGRRHAVGVRLALQASNRQANDTEGERVSRVG